MIQTHQLQVILIGRGFAIQAETGAGAFGGAEVVGRVVHLDQLLLTIRDCRRKEAHKPI
ncbi:MAG: hypothetical protein ABWY12_06875 [Burkholderiales bacterium]